MRPIKHTDATRQKLKAEFEAYINGLDKVSEIKFSKSLTFKSEEKAYVYMTPSAYAKQRMLVESTKDEVAWLGTVNRIDDVTFLIEDILVPPQTVSAAKVDTDDESYSIWMIEQLQRDPDVYSKLLFQAHSHNTMSASPSGTDLANQQEIVDLLPEDAFQIFMITNHKDEIWLAVYDLKNNVLYEKNEIVFDILLDDGSLVSEFVIDSEKNVEKPAPVVVTRYSYGGKNTGYSAASSCGSGKQNTKYNKSKSASVPVDDMSEDEYWDMFDGRVSGFKIY